ncbi:MAG: translation initiation factor [Muribaculum sp.]|nr:translation initiation factor [Muribaculum sp.]
MNTDWKDALGSLLKDGNLPQGEDTATDTGNTESTALRKQKLNIILDKKGRKGKTATLIEGFDLGEEEVKEIAATLKKKIGTGGAVRGSDILLQGDWRDKVRRILQDMNLI